jgi:hypothetical protein
VTLSCGIAILDPNEPDDALFARAKSLGRDRICLASGNSD